MTTPKDTPDRRHNPDLVDEGWCWVSDRDLSAGESLRTTGRVHLADCVLFERAVLRPVTDADVIWTRCKNCLDRETPWRAEQKRLDEADRLREAREADPELRARVRSEMERRRAER